MASKQLSLRWLVVFAFLILLLLGTSPGERYTRASSARDTPATAVVDPAVWLALRQHKGGQVNFITVCAPAAPHCTGPNDLLPILSVMKRVGSLQSFHIDDNGVLQATGSAASIRFLASFPSLARIDLVDTTQTVNASTQIKDLFGLSSTGRITGTVTGPDGLSPLNAINVTAYRFDGIFWVIAGTTSTGFDGTYDLAGLPATTFRLRFSDPTGTYVSEYYNDQRDVPSDPGNLITLTEGQVRGDIDASLALAGYISGTITTVNGGNPVVDFVASAYQYRDGQWRLDGSAVTDSSGNYEIRGLASESFIIRFADPYSPPRYLEEFYDNVLNISSATYVAVTAGITTSNIDASLGSYGSIAGTVTGPLGAGLVDITANIWQYNSSLADWELLGGGATDENGDYSVPGLVTRDYRVEFSDSKGQYGTEYYNNKTTVETANNVHVELGYTTPNIDAVLALAPDTVNHNLALDWNLISIPVVLDDLSTPAVLETITGTYEVVWAYDGCTSPYWLKYDPNDPLSSLSPRKPSPRCWHPLQVNTTWFTPMTLQMWEIRGRNTTPISPLATT